MAKVKTEIVIELSVEEKKFLDDLLCQIYDQPQNFNENEVGEIMADIYNLCLSEKNPFPQTYRGDYATIKVIASPEDGGSVSISEDSDSDGSITVDSGVEVTLVATANDVSMLPSELLRRGRFDELFFVDLPTADERREILSLYMRKYLKLEFSGPFAEKIVELTDGFTGADLESTVRDLAYRSIANSSFSLTEETMITSFNNVVPLSQTSPEKIEAIRDWGKERAVPASGKPIGGEELVQKKVGPKTRKVLV